MIRVLQTAVFTTWLAKLRDENAVRRIRARMFRMELGNFGDVKLLGDSVSEARIDYGPGYRVHAAGQHRRYPAMRW